MTQLLGIFVFHRVVSAPPILKTEQNFARVVSSEPVICSATRLYEAVPLQPAATDFLGALGSCSDCY